ncbi:1-deoxy-D-xylulose-5-phosphate synthase [uncultured Allobaculum sp.]|uniref:1-deoxy-D-xylulose-5-phosphate synthase n=1 Tax=uncultured Allobaculum sp. TaxID=1187017 RepID=UPI00259BD721|nr:1-deoxy-D-xylulose-5-phosphate synthase [uncultured Allobaculum sp.]
MNLTELKTCDDLRRLSLKEMEVLARQIRLFLLYSVSETGGHLSSNLGVVELTIALHYVFDASKDKLIFDVGHQSYAHKILTGRADQFSTLRQFHGLSGFQKRSESPADPWEAGHSSTSISAGLGFAAARDLLHQDYEVVSVIGDGAIGSGMALEALNDLGRQRRKMIIVFNDNTMSISPNDSGLEKSITRLRTSKVYRDTKKDLSQSLSSSEAGQEILHFLKRSRDMVRQAVVDAPLFSQFNLNYIGPVDGHDIGALISAFQTAREKDEPVVVHVITKKGKGYPMAENDTIGLWHGVGPFDVYTGKPLAAPVPGVLSWSEAIARTLMRLLALDPKLAVVTPAMATGSELLPIARRYPDRFFDTGIAEEHAMTMTAAMAAGGLHPFLSIYSSFLQRAYDQVLHDTARMHLPVVVGIDRAGLVGADGDTHQGIYDIAFLSTVPDIVLCQPKDALEAQDLLYSGFHQNMPWFIRYPRGKVPFTPKEHLALIPAGTWTVYSTFADRPADQIVIAYGPEVDRILDRARQENLSLMVVNARFLKPLDDDLLKKLFESGKPITVYETDSYEGGLAMQIQARASDYKRDIDVLTLKEGFIEQGSVEQLKKEQHISLDDLMERLKDHAS